VRPAVSSSRIYTRNRLQKSYLPSSSTTSIIEQLRGGGTKEVDVVKSKKRKGKSSKKSSAPSAKEDSDDKDNIIIKDTKQQTKPTTSEETSSKTSNKPHNTNKQLPSYTEHTFDIALLSLGLSLGTSGTDIDSTYEAVYNQDGTKNLDSVAYYQYSFRNSVDDTIRRRKRQQYDSNEEEYEQPSLSVVLGNYFLKTNGGTHIISCLLSILTSVLGMACLVLPSFPTSTNMGKNINAKILSRKILLATTKYQLMQQTLLVAMAKYMTGMVGAILLSASSIPQLGVRNVRQYLELTASEPIGQYLFYTALLVVWMGMFGGGSGGGKMSEYAAALKKSVISIMNESAASAATTDDSTTVAQLLDTLSQQPPPWFLSNGGAVIPLLILGPILLREIISIIWVFSDVLTLAIKSSEGMTGKLFSGMLTTCRATLDAFMSILLSSDKWRKADSFQRQRHLSKLVSRTSLVMELIVGILLIGDALQVVWTFAFGNVSTTGVVAGRVPFKTVFGKIVCAHLYLNFIKSRRKKIARTVIGSTRGGGIHIDE